MVKDVLTARQLVFNENHEIYACEFLCLDEGAEDTSSSVNVCPSKKFMTTKRLANVCESIAESERHLDVPIFINVDQTFLSETDDIYAVKPNIILEILASIKMQHIWCKAFKTIVLILFGIYMMLSAFVLSSSAIVLKYSAIVLMLSTVYMTLSTFVLMVSAVYMMLSAFVLTHSSIYMMCSTLVLMVSAIYMMLSSKFFA